MKKMFVAGTLFLAVACGSGGNANSSSNGTDSVKGNSAGSNIEEMDTMHMDTTTHKTTDSAR